MRIAGHRFDAPNQRFVTSTSAALFVKIFAQPRSSLYTTPSGLNSPQTPDIVSQRQRHFSVKNQKTRHFDDPD
jgi:hypothetical protein